VETLPAESHSPILVQWSGQDDAGGSGIAHYDIYVATDGGPYELWQPATPATSATYTGQIGHTYAFYSIATDNVGFVEATPATFDTQTTVTTVVWQNPSNQFDVDGDGSVNASDVILLVNYINSHPNDPSLPAPPTAPPPYYDINNDGLCTPLDVLMVINDVNEPPEGEGEAVAEVATLWAQDIAELARVWTGIDGVRSLPTLATERVVSASPDPRDPAQTPRPSRPTDARAGTHAPLVVDTSIQELDAILPDIINDIVDAWSSL